MVPQRLLSHFFLSPCRPEASHRELIGHFSTERVFPWPAENGKHPHAILHSVCVSSLIYFVSPSVSVWWSFVYRTVARWRDCLEVVTPLMSSMIHGLCRGNTRLCLFDLPHQRLATFWEVFGLKWHKWTAVDSFYTVAARKSCTKGCPLVGTDPSRHWVHPGGGAGTLQAWDKNYKSYVYDTETRLKFCNRRNRVNLTTLHKKATRKSQRDGRRLKTECTVATDDTFSQ